MRMFDRRSALKGAAALAGMAAVGLPGLTEIAQAAPRQPGAPGRERSGAPAAASSGATASNVLLVHGAWADGSSWSRVIPLLRAAGLHVVGVQLPMVSLANDVAWVQHVLKDRLQGPTVLVGHSYGGAVISGAGVGLSNVVSLAFVAAFAPAAGESLGALVSKYPPTPGLGAIATDSQGYFWIDPTQFPSVFAQDVDPITANVMATVEKPFPGPIFGEPAGQPAWQTLPTWYMVATNDRMIQPDEERWMAGRMKATTVEVASSHAAMVSHPVEVMQLILAAAGVVAS